MYKKNSLDHGNFLSKTIVRKMEKERDEMTMKLKAMNYAGKRKIWRPDRIQLSKMYPKMRLN